MEIQDPLGRQDDRAAITRRDDFVVIASGPSLTQEDCNRVHGHAYTIVVNSSFRMAPWADLLYAADRRWWQFNYIEVRKAFHGHLWTCCYQASMDYRLNWIVSRKRSGLGKNGVIHEGGNSGYQAINMAYLLGAKRIVLLGFDMGMSEDGREHWHPPHMIPIESRYDVWIAAFEQLAVELKEDGVQVLNASRQTKLTCFDRIDASDLPLSHCAG